MLAPGTVLGRFEILNLLSVGGMAEIYLARSEGIAGFEKRVVLKRMLPHFSSQQSYIEMFLAEARLGAMLDHPNVVQVHDIGESTGDYYYAMEYVAGVDLREIVQAERRAGRSVPIPIVAAIGKGLCAGLDFAHNLATADGRPLNVVHRDVSLSNVLISWGGSVKVLDFGVAKTAVDKSKTRVGTLKGKLGYMSPEQCKGEALDRRSDVFSIGIILWELLCGERLFSGDVEFAVLQRIVDADVPAPSTIRPDVPRLLEAIVLRALRKDRNERYQSARDLQRDLETFARNERLAIGGIELGEYMTELFPPEGRGSEVMLGAAILDENDADFSVELEIVDEPAKANKKAAAAAAPAAPTTPSQFSLLAQQKHWRVGAIAVAVASLVAITIAGISGKKGPTTASTRSTGEEPDARGQWQPMPSPTPPAAPAPAAAASVQVAAPAPAIAAPAPDAQAAAGAPATHLAVNAAPEREPARVDERTRRGISSASQRERERVERAPSHAARGAAAAPEPVPVAEPAAEEPPVLAAAAPAMPPDAAPPPVATMQKPAPPAATDSAVLPPPAAPARVVKPAGPGSLDAVASIGHLEVNGAMPASTVRRGVERSLAGYRECYRTAARSAAKTPAATVKVSFEIDESGLVRNVKAGDSSLPGMASCMRDTTARMRSQSTPDVGVAHAAVVITFAPTGP